MTADHWRKTRETLLRVLRDYKSGVTHGEDDNGAPTREMTAARIASVKRRIADLDAKLVREAKT